MFKLLYKKYILEIVQLCLWRLAIYAKKIWANLLT